MLRFLIWFCLIFGLLPWALSTAFGTLGVLVAMLDK